MCEYDSLLAEIINICLKNNRIPGPWKESLTVLIYKKGDHKDPSNWRPISLQCTIYKIFTAVLARRLAEFCIEGNIISPFQKGFMPYEGCFEHAFMMTSLLEDSKRNCKDLYTVWFDLENAFGSVLHSVLFDMMSRLEIPNSFISLCKDIYSGSLSRIRTGSGYTDTIPLRMGVKQGCPLSPLLFNLVLQGMLHGLDGVEGGYKMSSTLIVKYLAYADDLCIVASSKDEVSAFISKMEEFMDWAGLSFNVQKCASLSCINSSPHKYVQSFSPLIKGKPVRALKWSERYRYLGVETGRTGIANLDALRQTLVNETSAICSSLLTDWQKIDAINTFVISKATYYLRAALPTLGWVRQIDKEIRSAVKKGLQLPRRTISHVIYTKRCVGGLGLFCLEDNLQVARLTQMCRCLTSPDSAIRNCAWSQLRQTVSCRGRKNPTNSDLELFLNSPIPIEERQTRDVKSLWSDARKSLEQMGLKVDLTRESPALVAADGESFLANDRRTLNNFLRCSLANQHLSELVAAKDQGRAFEIVSLSPASNFWISSGQYLSFAEYRFALKARCNLLPVKTVVARMGRGGGDKICPKCHHQPETLAHVLNACPVSQGLMRARHNNIVERVKRAVSNQGGQLLLDQKIPDSPGQLRPDIVHIKDNSITIVDVTVPIESGVRAFEAARGEKENKYSDLVQWAKTKYTSVNFGSLIIGSLGSWDPANEETLRLLKIGKSYATLFRKLCCIDAIKGSLNIWRARNSQSTP